MTLSGSPKNVSQDLPYAFHPQLGRSFPSANYVQGESASLLPCVLFNPINAESALITCTCRLRQLLEFFPLSLDLNVES